MDRTLVRSPRTVVAAGLVTLVAGILGLLAFLFGRGRAAARDVPISPVTADRFVGPEFVERRRLSTGETVPGELDDVSTLASDSFDPDRLHPAVGAFYERTGEYDVRYRTTWHVPFRTGAALATRLTHRVQQLALPGPDDGSWHALESRFLAVEEPTDGIEDGAADRPTRDDVRAWIRTDPETGRAVFVALYATHERDGERLVNIAAPFPGGNVSTVLRPELLDATADAQAGIRLTTEGSGDVGLYLRTPFGPVKLPAGQEFRVWADEADTLGAVHEMWLLGRRFLTVDYELTPPAASQRATADEIAGGTVDQGGEETDRASEEEKLADDEETDAGADPAQRRTSTS